MMISTLLIVGLSFAGGDALAWLRILYSEYCYKKLLFGLRGEFMWTRLFLASLAYTSVFRWFRAASSGALESGRCLRSNRSFVSSNNWQKQVNFARGECCEYFTLQCAGPTSRNYPLKSTHATQSLWAALDGDELHSDASVAMMLRSTASKFREREKWSAYLIS